MTAGWLKAVNDHISQVSGKAFKGEMFPAGGGCINQAFRLEDGGQERVYFVKLNHAQLVDMFATEAEGLKAIADTQTIRVPAPLCHGVADGKAYLVMEWIDLASGGDWQQMGKQLALLHSADIGEAFGWHRNNYIGTIDQMNQKEVNWPHFFAEHRLKPQFERGERRGGRFVDYPKLLEAVPAILEGHGVKPSLVHGDLWSGNLAFTDAGEPVIYDVACYWGDGEVDLAMSELFGRLPGDFYTGYDAVKPIGSGYQRRRTLYNLYHILNHFNLFGGGYGLQANAMIGELLKELG
jgi:fructosamine-3-kinase